MLYLIIDSKMIKIHYEIIIFKNLRVYEFYVYIDSSNPRFYVTFFKAWANIFFDKKVLERIHSLNTC